MTKIKLKKPKHLSDGRIGRTGQVFEVEENKAAYFVGMGTAELTTEPLSPLPPKYRSTAKERMANEQRGNASMIADALREVMQPPVPVNAEIVVPNNGDAVEVVTDPDFPVDDEPVVDDNPPAKKKK